MHIEALKDFFEKVDGETAVIVKDSKGSHYHIVKCTFEFDDDDENVILLIDEPISE